MKNRFNIILKMILVMVSFWLLNVIFRIGPQIVLSLLETCCNEFDVDIEFKKHIFLYVSYGISDFLSILISLWIFNKKKILNSKIFMILFMLILFFYNLDSFKYIYEEHRLILLEDLNIYLNLIVILFLLINMFLIRKKLLKL